MLTRLGFALLPYCHCLPLGRHCLFICSLLFTPPLIIFIIDYLRLLFSGWLLSAATLDFHLASHSFWQPMAVGCLHVIADYLLLRHTLSPLFAPICHAINNISPSFISYRRLLPYAYVICHIDLVSTLPSISYYAYYVTATAIVADASPPLAMTPLRHAAAAILVVSSLMPSSSFHVGCHFYRLSPRHFSSFAAIYHFTIYWVASPLLSLLLPLPPPLAILPTLKIALHDGFHIYRQDADATTPNIRLVAGVSDLLPLSLFG